MKRYVGRPVDALRYEPLKVEEGHEAPAPPAPLKPAKGCDVKMVAGDPGTMCWAEVVHVHVGPHKQIAVPEVGDWVLSRKGEVLLVLNDGDFERDFIEMDVPGDEPSHLEPSHPATAAKEEEHARPGARR